MPSAAPRRTKPRIPLPDLGGETAQPVRLNQAGGGPTALMKGEWRDPDDTSPTGSKFARQVKNWRAFCPLRKMWGHSSVSDMHIHAADQLRYSADAAGIGFSADKDDLPVTSIIYGPKAGPPKRDEQSLKGWRDFRRAIRPFGEYQLRMLEHVILRNWALSRWIELEEERRGAKPNAQLEMGLLLGILEVLLAYYRSEIEQGLANGWIIPIV
jgi:hypothetical protein